MTADPYRAIAPLYDRVLSPLLRTIRRDIATYIGYRRFHSVIDICCGTGEQLRLLVGQERTLCGIDNSLAMLAQAKQHGPETIEYHLLDAEQTTFSTNTFDCAIISFALHEKHPAAARAVYKNAWRLVRPGGAIVLADFSQVPTGLKGFVYGRLAIPLVERLAGRDHYRNYRLWMENGALESFIGGQSSGADVISRPFSQCCLCCAVDVTAAGLSLNNSLVLLDRALADQRITRMERSDGR
jgi:demethylmenaquinone methyltransferase/2-methoxy-6-polyprenyl-1,4-benzoquinol methylase